MGRRVTKTKKKVKSKNKQSAGKDESMKAEGACVVGDNRLQCPCAVGELRQLGYNTQIIIYVVIVMAQSIFSEFVSGICVEFGPTSIVPL